MLQLSGEEPGKLFCRLLRVVLHHSTGNWDLEGRWLQLVCCTCLLSVSLYFVCENSGSRKSEGQRNVASFTGSQESGSHMEVGNLEVGIWKSYGSEGSGSRMEVGKREVGIWKSYGSQESGSRNLEVVWKSGIWKSESGSCSGSHSRSQKGIR